MLWEDKVILLALKKRALRKGLRDQLKVFEEEIRKERTVVPRNSSLKYSSVLRKSCSQDTDDPVKTPQNSSTVEITNGAGEDLAEKRPDLDVVQEMLFTEGALDMEKLLCLHLLAKQAFIGRIRRTQVRFQPPRREKRGRGDAAGTDEQLQVPREADSALKYGRGYAVNLSSISFLSEKVHLAPSQPDVSGSRRKKMLSQVPSAAGCCGRPEEYLERLVDSVLEALCESNPTKLCTLLQMERDEATLSRVLSSHKVQRFMQQVCGRDVRCTRSQPTPQRWTKCVPELLRLQRARRLTAERHLSPEELLRLSQKLRNAGFRIDLLEDIENIIDALWQEELPNKPSESDMTSDAESRKQALSSTSYSSTVSLPTQLPLVGAVPATHKKSSCSLVQVATQEQEGQKAPSLLSRLSATMSTHSDVLHQKVKAYVWHAEAISSGETTVTLQQRAVNAAH